MAVLKDSRALISAVRYLLVSTVNCLSQSADGMILPGEFFGPPDQHNSCSTADQNNMRVLLYKVDGNIKLTLYFITMNI